MDEIELLVEDLPPAKSEAKSMLAESHRHHARVTKLLEAARRAMTDADHEGFGSSPVGLDVTVTALGPLPSDATNYLGGIADVLEGKHQRGAVSHLGELASVELYDNDRQIQDVRFTWEPGPAPGYRVRVWRRS